MNRIFIWLLAILSLGYNCFLLENGAYKWVALFGIIINCVTFYLLCQKRN